ncbi:MAG: hypothetical protein A2Z17_04400 [Gammaproteobacteria bacterium RBG_16_66_13]|nr:MAG: hypothetical protein A2Z17_04400 [Gammaproteobacteria bacterium RBG_16_66_13]
MSGDLYSELLPLLHSPSRDPIRERVPAPGGRVWSFCPRHADGAKHGKRSLSLRPPGELKCFAGCGFRDVLHALRERAGVHPARTLGSAPYHNGNGAKRRDLGRVTGRWIYADADGQALFAVMRLDGPDGKTFLQQHPAGRGECCGAEDDPCKPVRDALGWRWGHGRGVSYVLYRLAELLAAEPSEPVFVVEGERKVDALRAIGLVATCGAEGAGKWRHSCTESLRGRRVVILPDNDRPGVAHAEQAGRELLGAAAEVRYVVLPGLRHKQDVVNWLAAGGTREQLLALAALAPVVRPPSQMFPKGVDCRVLDATKVLAS